MILREQKSNAAQYAEVIDHLDRYLDLSVVTGEETSFEVTLTASSLITTHFLEVGMDEIGPKRLITGKTICKRLTIGAAGQEAVIWLPYPDDEGLFWWAGQRRCLPHIRLVVLKESESAEEEREPMQDDGDGSSNEEDSTHTTTKHDPSEEQLTVPFGEDRELKITYTAALLERVIGSLTAKHTSVKGFKLKRVLDPLYKMLVIGGSNSVPWLTPVDSESAFGEEVAKDLTLTAELKWGSLRIQSWGKEARERSEHHCDLHTPGNSGAGLTRHLKVQTVKINGMQVHLGKSALSVPHWELDEPRRLLLASGHLTHAEPLAESEDTAEQPPGVELLTAFSFWGGWNHEDAIVISESAASRLALKREVELSYPIPWSAEVPQIKIGDSLSRGSKPRARIMWYPIDGDEMNLNFMSPREAWSGIFTISLDGRKIPWPAHVDDVNIESFDTKYDPDEWANRPRPNSVRAVMTLSLSELTRPARRGDKMFNRHGNKGVIALVLPDVEMPYMMSNGERVSAEVVVNPIGVINRGNFGQLQEAIDSWGEGSALLDDGGRASMFVDGTDGNRTSLKAIFGKNLWMRSLHEANRQSKLCGSSATDLPRALSAPRGLRMRSTGLKYGELNAWALATRKHARTFVERSLHERSSSAGSGRSDRQLRVNAWRWLVWHNLGYAASGQGFQVEKLRNKVLSEDHATMLNKLPRSKSKDDKTKKKDVYKEKKSKGSLSPLKIDSETGFWLEEHITSSLKFDGNTNPVSFIKTTSEALTTRDDFALRRHLRRSLPAEVAMRVDKPRHDMLRRSPLVEWPLCLQVGRSYRGVIVPAPNLEMSNVELPWWVALNLFWDDLSEAQREQWGQTLSELPPGFLEGALEGIALDLATELEDQESEADDPVTITDDQNKLIGTELSTLCEQLSDAWVVIHRDPVLHYGSVWAMKVSVSPNTDNVIGFPPQALHPIGGDYDGDTVNVVPVGLIGSDHELRPFCEANSTLISSDDSEAPRLFNASDLNIDAESLMDEIKQDDMFPMEKDLALANQLLPEPRADYLRAEDFSAVKQEMFKYNRILCSAWHSPLEEYVMRSGLSESERLVLRGGDEGGKYLFKDDHLNAEATWWTNDYLTKLPLFFYESQRGAGLMGGLYRRMLHKHLPIEDSDRQKLFLVALQRHMERLQQSVLKFKKNEKPIDAQTLGKAWETVLAGKPLVYKSKSKSSKQKAVGDPPNPEADKEPPEFEAVKKLTEEKRPHSLKLLKSLMTELNPHSALWIYGQLAEADENIEMSVDDPRYLFIEANETLSLDKRWTPLTIKA